MSKISVYAVAFCLLAPMSVAAQAAADTGTEANKAKLLEFYRVVFEAQDVSHAGDFMAVDVVEHNPAAGQGLAGFVQGFGSRWKPRPVAAALRNPPVEMVAEGDLVQLVFKRPRPDPTDPTKTYDSFWFDLFRMKNGKIVEHWDGALKPSASPAK